MSGNQMAQALVPRDDKGHLLRRLPSIRPIDFGAIKSPLRWSLGPTDDNELMPHFSDCSLGSMPPIRRAMRWVMAAGDRRV